MSTFETELKNALEKVDALRTPECLDPAVVGAYAEEKLSAEEKEKAEGHLQKCLYCLKQLNEAKELLYWNAHPVKLSPNLTGRLRGLLEGKGNKAAKAGNSESFLEKLRGLIVFPYIQWRYGAVALGAACIAVLLTLSAVRRENPSGMLPFVDANSFVKVRALDDAGALVKEAQGVTFGHKGLIACNLSRLVGASSIRIICRDGKTYRTTRVWKDEEKNLAVMKVDNESLPAMPTADISEISIGQGVFLVANGDGGREDFKESLVSDFKQAPGRRAGGPMRYIQLATFSASVTQGAVVDGQGRLIGLLIAQEKRIGLASPIAEAEGIAKQGRTVAVNELKGNGFSAEALDLYLKGILARDEQRWEEAVDLFKKATELNPRLEGAHLELAYAYYKKRLYDLEAREYEEVLKLNPENTAALFGLAANLETRGAYEQAIKTYEKGLSLDRTDADSWYELGLAYLAQGQKAKAQSACERLRTLDRGSAEMLRNLMR